MKADCDCQCHEGLSVITHDEACCGRSTQKHCAIVDCSTPWEEVHTLVSVKLPPRAEEHLMYVCKSHARELKPAASGYSMSSYAVPTK